jgi:hypothetical protein
VQPIHRCDGRIRTKVLRVIDLSAKVGKASEYKSNECTKRSKIAF